MPIHIVPRPVNIHLDSGEFALHGPILITSPPESVDVAYYLAQFLRSSTEPRVAVRCEPSESDTDAPDVELRLTRDDPTLGDDGYRLQITRGQLLVVARENAGLFYGVQTIRQLLPADVEANRATGEALTIPCLRIDDHPRFPWRGLHLDVGRHFYPVDFIKKFIDLLALHKLNVFHWHLTEDQGWRLEIKRYPKLTEIGSKRAETPIPASPDRPDGIPYGGYYTHDEVRDVVRYARERFVSVVPEIEMPGHCLAALASYPELGCRGRGYHVWTRWGICKDVFCGGNPRVFEFLEHVLEEVVGLFPGDLIHIGGDECPRDRWRKCRKCQLQMRLSGLRDESELQGWFIERIATMVRSAGRRIIGWDEIINDRLPPDAVVMCWRDIRYGVQAAENGHDVIMAPHSHCYFDYRQSTARRSEPPGPAGCIPLAKVRELDPVPAALPDTAKHHIIGGQGNIWTEYIPTSELVEYMAFPRASALSEALWSPAPAGASDDFPQRLSTLLRRLKFMGVNYRPP